MRSWICNPTFRWCALGGLAALAVTLWSAPGRAAPLDIGAAVRLALEKNPSIEVAEARVARARALERQASSGFLPRAKLEASYTVTDNPSLAFSYILNQRRFPAFDAIDFNDVGEADDLGARATVEYPLFTGLRRFREADAAARGREASQAGLEATRRQLALETARAWIGVQKARAMIEAAEAGVRAFEANLAIARRREEAGTLLPQAVLEIETRLAGAREDLSRAQNGEALALEGLRTLLGLAPDEPLEVADPAPVPAPSATVEPKKRPELAAAELEAEAAEAKTRAAESGWLPTVGLSASIGMNRGFIDEGDSVSYIAGVGVEWKVFDGFVTAGQVDEARADAIRARAEGERLRLALRFALERARIALRDAQTRVEVSAQAVQLATRSVELARARFEEGAALPTQLVDAETELTAARIRNVDARADLDLAAVELRRALGLDPVPTSGETR